jgi:hypothetical protein
MTHWRLSPPTMVVFVDIECNRQGMCANITLKISRPRDNKNNIMSLVFDKDHKDILHE